MIVLKYLLNDLMTKLLPNLRFFSLLCFVLMISNSENGHAQSNDAYELLTNDCQTDNQSKCWKRLEDYLVQQKKPTSQRGREDLLFNYYILANFAHRSGDYRESEQFFANTLKLAVNVPIKDGGKEFFMTPMVQVDLAMLFLSMREFEKALACFDGANNTLAKESLFEDHKKAIALGRVAALGGLNRLSEIEPLLPSILDSLNYNETLPFEAWLFGPDAIDPYATGRKIARVYQRLGQEEKALHVLDSLEEKRALFTTKSGTDEETLLRRRTWASQTHQSDIFNDKAEIYLSQGKNREAEMLLLPISKFEIGKEDSARKRALLKLAYIRKTEGNLIEVERLTKQALSIKIRDEEPRHDPMLATFGFIK